MAILYFSSSVSTLFEKFAKYVLRTSKYLNGIFQSAFSPALMQSIIFFFFYTPSFHGKHGTWDQWCLRQHGANLKNSTFQGKLYITKRIPEVFQLTDYDYYLLQKKNEGYQSTINLEKTSLLTYTKEKFLIFLNRK